MPDTDGPQLALIIPTYRWDDLAKDTLIQAAAIGSDLITVHIGDNSANPEKHAFLEKLAARSTNVVVTCHPRNLGADPNWLFLVKSQTAPFICMAADDDSFGGAYFRAGLALVRDDPECATASGLHVSLTHPTHRELPALDTPRERRESDPLDRIRNYQGHNSICYAISKRTVIRAFAGYIEANPLQCPFNDYMLAFHLLSMGTYRMDRRGYVYIYDHTNWKLKDAFITSNARWYKGYGLPESFAYMTRLHWAVVATHFFSSTFRSPDLAPERAGAIVTYLFDRLRREFSSDFSAHRRKIDPLFAGNADATTALKRLMRHPYDRITPIFDDFAIVMAVFSPDVARRYRAFQADTIHPGPDTIAPPPGRLAKVQTAMLDWNNQRRR